MYNSSKYAVENESSDQAWRPPQLQRYLEDNHLTKKAPEPKPAASKLPMPLRPGVAARSPQRKATTLTAPQQASKTPPKSRVAPKPAAAATPGRQTAAPRARIEVASPSRTSALKKGPVKSDEQERPREEPAAEFKTLDDVKFQNLLRDDLLLNMIYDKDNLKPGSNLDGLRRQLHQPEQKPAPLHLSTLSASPGEKEREAEFESLQARFSKLYQAVGDDSFAKRSRKSASSSDDDDGASDESSETLDLNKGRNSFNELSVDTANDVSNASVETKLKSLRRQLQELRRRPGEAAAEPSRHKVSDSLEVKTNRLLERSDDSSSSSKLVSSDGVASSLTSGASLASSISSTSVQLLDQQLAHKPDFLKCYDLKAKHDAALGMLSEVVIDEPLASTEDILLQWRLRRKINDDAKPMESAEESEPKRASSKEQPTLRVAQTISPNTKAAEKQSESVKAQKPAVKKVANKLADTAIQTSLEFNQLPTLLIPPVVDVDAGVGKGKTTTEVRVERHMYNSADYEERRAQEEAPTRDAEIKKRETAVSAAVVVVAKPIPRSGFSHASPTFKQTAESRTSVVPVSRSSELKSPRESLTVASSASSSQFTQKSAGTVRRVDESTGSSIWSNVSPLGFKPIVKPEEKERLRDSVEVEAAPASTTNGANHHHHQHESDEPDPMQPPPQRYLPTVMSSIGSSVSSITNITTITQPAPRSDSTPVPQHHQAPPAAFQDDEEDPEDVQDEMLQVLLMKKRYYQTKLKEIDALLA